MISELGETAIENANYTTPWFPSKMTRPQPRPWFVIRRVTESGWEQLYTEEGPIARFETEEEAKAAADKANAGKYVSHASA